MNRTKDINIQVWTDMYYVRTIGIWYPPIADTSTLDAPPEQTFEPILDEPIIDPMTPTEVIIPQEEGAPFLIVTSSAFEPRQEVMGGNPIALGQSPMPKEFLETLVSNMSQLFANETGMFQLKTKALTNSFIAKQTISYNMIKEVPMTVTPVQGAMSLKDLKDYINGFSEEEQETIQVINNVEKPTQTDGKHIEEFIFGDKTDNQSMYITVTKLFNIYETADPYIKMTTLPEDPADGLAPGTEEAPNSMEIIDNTTEIIDADTVEREALETFDDITNPEEEIGTEEAPTTDDELPTEPIPEPTRVEVLEQLLVDKNQQLIDAGIIPPTVPEDPLTDMPEPSTQEDEFSQEVITELPIDEDMTPEDLEYAAMTAPPEDYVEPTNDIDDGMPDDGLTP